MNKLELMLVCGIIIISAPYLGVYLSHKLSIKRIKEKLSKPTIDLDEGNEETGQKFMGREYDRIRCNAMLDHILCNTMQHRTLQ